MEQNLQIIFALAVLLFIPSIQALVFSNSNSLNTLVRNEELPTGTVIIQATTDVPADSFEFTSTGVAATYFAINNTGYIYIKQRIDREALSSSRITGSVKATKGVNTATTAFACVINDINDNVPSYPKTLYEVSVSETTSLGSAIFSKKAVDGDDGQRRTILYGIASGNETGKFSISLYGGEVTLASHLDYETNKEYTLNITVRDVPGLSNWTILLVHVVDADDLPAKFTAYSYSASIREGATSGAPVIQVKAYDLDKGINSTVTYAIDQDSNPSRLFAIDDKTGEISLNGALDRETGDEYIIRVLASSSFPVGDHATVTIKVTDVNDNKPMLSQSTYNATVAENMATGTFVVQITATDKDEGINAKLRYSIQDGVDSNRFIIDYQTGKISTVVTLDREDKDSYTLIVLVEDMDGNSTIGTVYNDTATVYISVKDGNLSNCIPTRITKPEQIQTGAAVIGVLACLLSLSLLVIIILVAYIMWTRKKKKSKPSETSAVHECKSVEMTSPSTSPARRPRIGLPSNENRQSITTSNTAAEHEIPANPEQRETNQDHYQQLNPATLEHDPTVQYEPLRTQYVTSTDQRNDTYQQLRSRPTEYQSLQTQLNVNNTSSS